MEIIDVSIIVTYILITLFVGIWASKKASKGLKSYFLGGNSIKWYYLGLSMIFLAIWIRRSNIMTGSEWILTRFGNDKSGKASHIIVAIFAIISTIGFIAYFFEGVGKFMEIILTWDLTLQSAGTVLLRSRQSYA